MFYAHFVLAKKGPLARIWLAAHWEGKLTKAHVFETNIEKSVDGILQPKVKMALRTSGHLLLGVVRIYSRKAKYLLADCNEAFVKIKMAFRPGVVDLPEEHREANVNAITLPEVFHDFDTAMPELNDVDIEAQFSLNQTRAEEITMREDYGSINLVVTNDEGFGDMGFDPVSSEIIKTTALEPQINQAHLLFSDSIAEDHMNVDKDKEPQPSTSGSQTRSALEIDAPLRDDGFGGNLGQDIIAGGLFEDGFFDDAPLTNEIPPVDNPMIRKPSMERDDMDDDMGDHYGDTGSMGGHSIDGDSCPSTPAQGLILEPPPSEPQLMPPSEQPYSDHMEEHIGSMSNDQTTLLQNEAESFALAPVDVSTLKGIVKPRRKRKLIVDEVKNISGEEMKAQLSDTTDIVTTLDLAPPTKRLMHWKETGGVEKLFAVPCRSGFAKSLFRLYQRHLTSRSTETCDAVSVVDLNDDDIVFDPIKDPESDLPHVRMTRKRKVVEVEESPPQQEQLDMQHLILPAPQSYVLPDMSTVVPPPPATPQGYLPPATPQPEVPDMSTIDPVHLTSMVPNSVVPPTTNIPMPQSVPPQLNLDVEMPLLPPDQVHSILDQTEHLPAPPVIEQGPPLQPAQEEPPANMENMGYDANNPAMANMGYDGQAAASQAGDKGAGTPWNEDYEFPASVGPPEEQQTDETYEQFEERVLNKRAGQMYHIVKNKLSRSEQLYLSEMTQRNNRKQAAQKFYTLLVLKKHMVLELTQEHSYDDIMITRGNKFDNPSL